MEWADHILTAAPDITERVHARLGDAYPDLLAKVVEIPIGPDRWRTKAGPYNVELTELAHTLLTEAGFI
jgi:hypothetical protein